MTTALHLAQFAALAVAALIVVCALLCCALLAIGVFLTVVDPRPVVPKLPSPPTLVFAAICGRCGADLGRALSLREAAGERELHDLVGCPSVVRDAGGLPVRDR
jgi:hypothetical protein